MDFITHALTGAGVARLVTPRREWLPQLTLAGLLGSLLMDGDSWLYLIRPDYYGLYHRVFTHCLFGLGATTLAAAGLAVGAAQVGPWRRWGWFVTDSLAPGEIPSRPPWCWFLGVTALAAALHFAGDVITGYGNLKLFWPWSAWDASLHAVFSFDPFLFGATIVWYLTLRYYDLRRRRAWLPTAFYLLAAALYVAARLRWSAPSYW